MSLDYQVAQCDHNDPCKRRQEGQTRWQELWPAGAWSERKGPEPEKAGDLQKVERQGDDSCLEKGIHPAGLIWDS